MYYYSLNNYLKKAFGCKIYKISLNGGMTCPNRDGTLGNNGCIFCSEKGSGDFASSSMLSVTQQINEAILRVKNKSVTNKYIAYFQPFTNTYADIKYLRNIYYEAINNDLIVGLSVATRPDCLSDEIIDLLHEINKIKPVWVELGLQTIHEATAKYIRRNYSLDVYDSAIKKLNYIKVHVVTHVILGLPGENKNDMLETVSYVGKKTDGIKLQLLHVLKNTDLCIDYLDGKFNTLELDEYIDILCDCIKILPKHVVIHRLTGDGDKNILVSPLWSANKKLVLNSINREFFKNNIIQGAMYHD